MGVRLSELICSPQKRTEVYHVAVQAKNLLLGIRAVFPFQVGCLHGEVIFVVVNLVAAGTQVCAQVQCRFCALMKPPPQSLEGSYEPRLMSFGSPVVSTPGVRIREPFSGSWEGVCQWVTPLTEWQISQETPARATGHKPEKPGLLMSPVTIPAGE